MNWYEKDFWQGASVGAVAGVITGVTQANLGVAPIVAGIGGVIVFAIVAGLAPFVRRWKSSRARSEN